MMLRFCKQFSANVIAVAIPALSSMLFISVLVRAANPETTGIMLWTWFLMTTAAGLNIGLHPSLTNELGALDRTDSRWPSLLAHYMIASNTIFSVIAFVVAAWVVISESHWQVLGLQLFIVWLTGIVSLVMTALNFNGDASLTALSKMVFNTLCFAAPVGAILMGGGVIISLTVLLILKALQLWLVAGSVTRRMQQHLALVWVHPLNVQETIEILKRQWRLVAISGTQMSFAFIDRYIVIAAYGIAAYKNYGGLLDVLGIVWVGSSIFIILIHPQLAQPHLSPREKIRLSDKFSRILVVLGGVILGVFLWKADWVIGLVLDINMTQEYYIIVRNMVGGLFFNLTYVLYNTLLIATGRQAAVLYASVPVLVFYCIVAPLVAVEHGLVGLSYAFLIRFFVEAVVFHVMVGMVRRA